MDIQWNTEKNLVHIRLSGVLDKKIILEAFELAVLDNQYKNGMARLWDFRNADLSGLESGTIRAMTRFSMKFQPGTNDVKVAFLVSRDLEVGLTNIFKFSSDAPTSIRIFRNIEEAEEWINTPENDH